MIKSTEYLLRKYTKINLNDCGEYASDFDLKRTITKNLRSTFGDNDVFEPIENRRWVTDYCSIYFRDKDDAALFILKWF